MKLFLFISQFFFFSTGAFGYKTCRSVSHSQKSWHIGYINRKKESMNACIKLYGAFSKVQHFCIIAAKQVRSTPNLIKIAPAKPFLRFLLKGFIWGQLFQSLDLIAFKFGVNKYINVISGMANCDPICKKVVIYFAHCITSIWKS